MEDSLPIGKESYNRDHVHNDKVMSEYTSTGPNLLDQIVTAKMAKTYCDGCGSEGVKFISAV